jgi:C_GCAxxG_C_C family probable redox protein
MSKRTEEAVSVISGGYNCAQAVLSAFAQEFGVERGQAMKIAAGFGGGMVRQGDTCGVVTGALMVLGLRHGSGELDDSAKKQLHTRAWQFLADFKARHGSTVCRDLLECDLGTEEGRKRAQETRVTKVRCPGFVESAVQILERADQS